MVTVRGLPNTWQDVEQNSEKLIFDVAAVTGITAGHMGWTTRRGGARLALNDARRTRQPVRMLGWQPESVLDRGEQPDPHPTSSERHPSE